MFGTHRNVTALCPVLLAVALLAPEVVATAAGINTDVALPVRKGGFVFRTQARWLRATDDPTSLDRDVNVVSIPNVLVYGASPELALFAIVPYIFRNTKFTDHSTGKRGTEEDSGLGDAILLGRYTVLTRDYPSGTARVALLAGIKLPTGDDELEPITTDSMDIPLGWVSTVTWDFGRHELDMDAVYRINTEADAFEKGDELIYDVAYQLRIHPWSLPETGTPDFIYVVAELNGAFMQKSEQEGRTISDSGGHTVFFSPGLQFATRRFILEASIQLPIVSDLNGGQLETDYVIATGFRVNLP